MNNIIIIILLLVFFFIILKVNVKTENFIDIDQIFNKKATDTMEGALKLSAVTDTKRFENVIGEDLLTTLLEHDYSKDKSPENSLGLSSDKLVTPQNPLNIEETTLSINERQKQNRNLRKKIFSRKYTMDNTLNNIANELYSLLKQRQDVNSVEYDNYSRNLHDLFTKINKYKEMPGYDSDIEISRLFNEIAFVYVNNNNITKSLENIENALNYLSKIPEYFNPLKVNFYKGLTYHNKGVIRKDVDDLNTSKNKYIEALNDISDKKLKQEDIKIKNNCNEKLKLVENDIYYLNNCINNDSIAGCPTNISFPRKNVDGIWINPKGLEES